MPKRSSGLLMYRRHGGALQVFLAHPGRPVLHAQGRRRVDDPEGRARPGEDPLACAKREFLEETGLAPQAAGFIPLGEIKQRGGKIVQAWAFEGEWGERELSCNTFELEWPPRSGRMQSFPEIDRADYFTIDEARRKLNPAQVELLDRLLVRLA